MNCVINILVCFSRPYSGFGQFQSSSVHDS